MRIGFDAKRIFFNGSGLGNYSRSTVDLLAQLRPDDNYLLFSPKRENRMGYRVPEGVETYYPSRGFLRGIPSLWRSFGMAEDIRAAKTDLYHGLSNELPMDIRQSGAKSVLTVHDLIFVRFPELYRPADAAIYKRKYGRSCQLADKIVAISKQTRDDLMRFWNIPAQKIEVVYQGCNPMFYERADETEKEAVRRKYDLPERYILSVGSVERRKNLLLTLQAIVDGKIDISLVACGKYTPYQDELKAFAEVNGIGHRVHFRNSVTMGDLPAIYQMASVCVYISLFEGFGIPILEALNSGVPVITSEGGVFPETGGDACLYVEQHDIPATVEALKSALYDTRQREGMIARGYAYAQRFREERIAEQLHDLYHSL